MNRTIQTNIKSSRYTGNRLKGIVTATVLRENPKTLIVRLPDGNVIKRHKQKRLV